MIHLQEHLCWCCLVWAPPLSLCCQTGPRGTTSLYTSGRTTYGWCWCVEITSCVQMGPGLLPGQLHCRQVGGPPEPCRDGGWCEVCCPSPLMTPCSRSPSAWAPASPGAMARAGSEWSPWSSPSTWGPSPPPCSPSSSTGTASSGQ